MQMFISYLKLTMNFKLFNICPPFAVMPIFQTHYLNDKKNRKRYKIYTNFKGHCPFPKFNNATKKLSLLLHVSKCPVKIDTHVANTKSAKKIVIFIIL